ncbi:MAG: PSD1 and planctomycete cytochrome C domain-containing protein [Pirellulales bacterium]
MPTPLLRSPFAWLLATSLGCSLSITSLAPSGATAAEPEITFEQHIRPLLKAHCFHCHGEEQKVEGRLDLRLRRTAVAGGESGPGIIPGQPDASRLYQRIRDGEMPPKGKLTDEEKSLVARWIAGGAAVKGPEPDDPNAVSDITDDERNFWAFQRVFRPALPTVSAPAKLRSPIDAFLLQKLEAQQLTFAPPAAKATLLRRLSFDLWGLPPAPEEVAEFEQDDAPDALARAVDRWLASPRYGERYGRHWLDAAGYADSDGYSETDPVRKYSYKYRDWVIRALNADRPFDEFYMEQLAGDELASPPYTNLTPDSIDRLVATGFLRTVPDGSSSGVAPKESGNAVMAETIKVVSTSMLGMTVGCAQCHNHRYDPIPQTDYYRMRAIFEPALDWKKWRNPQQRLISLYTDADRAQAAAIEAEAVMLEGARQAVQLDYIQRTADHELAKIAGDRSNAARAARDTPAAKRTPEQQQLIKEFPAVNVDAGSLYLYDAAAAADLKKRSEDIAAVRAKKPVEDFLAPLTEIPGHLPTTAVFDRGDPDVPKAIVPPGDLSVVSTAPFLEKDPERPTSGRRLAFAKHLTNGQHPLVARVLVNRLWMHHFGRGIVATPGDFGKLGARPTHPELLDWLADRFVAKDGPIGGWSAKRFHREAILSTAWRQSSRREPAVEARDPDNQWWSRMPIRRLEAESLRDAVLAVNGMLNLKAYGPPIPVMEDDVGQIVIGIENKNGENRPGPIIPMHGEDYRRSLYVQVRRTRPLGVLDAFDLPTLEPNCTGRSQSTVAPQSLLLMNSDFALEQSAKLAHRLALDAGENRDAFIRNAFTTVFGRLPSADEMTKTRAFIARQIDAYAAQPKEKPDQAIDATMLALASFCQALLSSNEFLYVD